MGSFRDILKLVGSRFSIPVPVFSRAGRKVGVWEQNTPLGLRGGRLDHTDPSWEVFGIIAFGNTQKYFTGLENVFPVPAGP